ncbi:hypothetical protein [Pontimonas sp.]|uniref:hypothetical protein n=1 Tax=Pontimonas sp. TaxID=2304492 RepID=UPI00286FE449|nr:hypothetical protein [Pontimonas sp.]MDR9434449.1 hypothetical protein [Pontimonas sp.]
MADISVILDAGSARMEDDMKTAQILTITAAGALGSLLLGGAAFATGAAIGVDARDDRIEQVQQRAHEHSEQGQPGKNQRRGAQADTAQAEGAQAREGHRTERGAGEHREAGEHAGAGEHGGAGEAAREGSGPGTHPRDDRPGAQGGVSAEGTEREMVAPWNLGIGTGAR